jgi:DNA-directed RNA polymerase specialized sigma24 family protein
VGEEHARVAPAPGSAPPKRRPRPSASANAVLASAAARGDLDRLLDGLTDEQRRVPVIHGWDGRTGARLLPNAM